MIVGLPVEAKRRSRYRGPVKFTIVKSKVYPVKQFLQFTFNWGSFHRGDSVVNEKKTKSIRQKRVGQGFQSRSPGYAGGALGFKQSDI